MIKNYKKITAVRLIMALIAISVLTPATAHASLIDVDGIGSWIKNKVSPIVWAKELSNEIDNEALSTINGIAVVSAVKPLTGIVQIHKILEVIVTGYSSSVDETDDTPFITASGEHVRDGIVAANFLPFGTKIMIPEMFGNKVFEVKDRMAKKHNEKVDIWFESKSLAKTFGKRKLEIQVVSEI